jgi:hypothetical protein
MEVASSSFLLLLDGSRSCCCCCRLDGLLLLLLQLLLSLLLPKRLLPPDLEPEADPIKDKTLHIAASAGHSRTMMIEATWILCLLMIVPPRLKNPHVCMIGSPVTSSTKHEAPEKRHQTNPPPHTAPCWPSTPVCDELLDCRCYEQVCFTFSMNLMIDS